jgi:hypothetical protein
MDQETKAALLGQVRVILTALGGGLVTKGIITADQETAIITGILGILSIVAGAVWSWYQHKYLAPATIVSATSSTAAAMSGGAGPATAAAQGASISGASDSTVAAARSAATPVSSSGGPIL